MNDMKEVPPPLVACPRWASREERDTWLGSLTLDQQISRGDLDPPAHEYSEAELALARKRREQREAQKRPRDPFCYADARHGPWPRVDTIEAPALSNTWRPVEDAGWTPAGFPWAGLRRVPHRELVEERIPRGARKEPEKRAAWVAEAIGREEAEMCAALRLVLAERHGRLRRDESKSTILSMAWNHLAAGRAALRALRELQKDISYERQRSGPHEQLGLF